MLYRLSYLGKQEPTFRVGSESGRRDSNSRPSPWQGDVLPLNYARKALFNYQASIPPKAHKRKSILLLKRYADCAETTEYADIIRVAQPFQRHPRSTFHQWTRSDSNRRSPPCKGGAFPLGYGPGIIVNGE